MKTKLIQKIKEEFGRRFETNRRFGGFPYGELWSFIEKAISQSKEELMEEVRSKITEFAIEGGKVRDEWKGAVLYSKIMTFLEDLNKKC